MTTSRFSDFTGFFDDAAIFPPGSAELPDAVRAHLQRRSAPIQPLVGPLLLTEARLSEAAALATEMAGELGIDLAREPLRVGLVVAPGALDQALRVAAEPPQGVVISGLELKTDQRWREQLAAGVELAQDAPYSVHVELSGDAVAEGGVKELAGTAARLKYRTGGLEATLFPSVAQLASVIDAAAQAEVPFKLTAGLHQAVRHTGPKTGFQHHGFLNIALATAAARSGADFDRVQRLLAERDHDAVRAAYAETSASWRTLFESFGTCSISEPIESLIALDLLDPALLSTT